MGHSVGLKVDARQDEPLHRQIFDQIVSRIQSRAFPPGYKLPPTRVLAREMGTHRNTVARAYADLEEAGFVTGSVGRGTFVEEPRAGQARPAVTRLPSTPNAASAAAREIPWRALTARSARPEILGRTERWGRRADGRDVVNLARMQPSSDLLPTELMRRCLARAMAEHGGNALTYAPPEGVPRLREQIVAELASRGVPASADDILVTSGSQQGLDLVARMLVNPGDTILVEPTTYAGAIDLFALAGARLVTVGEDEHGPDPAALDRLVHPDVKALYLMPTGHNPTGRTIPAERRHAIARWSRAAGIPLIEDDFVAGLELEAEPAAVPHFRALDGEVIHLSSFSKRLIPGIRVGYVVVPSALRAPMRSLHRVVSLGSSAILQHALAEFMERGYLRAHMTKVTREYRARRDALVDALERSMPEGVRWRVPTHGIVLWLSLPSELDPSAVYEEALRQGVHVNPSPMWTIDPSLVNGVRLTFCAESKARVAEGARRLGKALKTVLAQASRARPERTRVLEAV